MSETVYALYPVFKASRVFRDLDLDDAAQEVENLFKEWEGREVLGRPRSVVREGPPAEAVPQRVSVREDARVVPRPTRRARRDAPRARRDRAGAPRRGRE